MEIGYCWVSTEDQNLDMQRATMDRAGISKIFEEKASGKTMRGREGLEKAITMCRRGDTLVVWKLDRLARSLVELDTLSKRLKERGVGLRSLTEAFDTTTPGGTLLFQLLGLFAEFERNLLVERTRHGMAAAKARGAQIGRKNALSGAEAAEMLEMIRTTPLSMERIGKAFGISKTAVYHYCPGGREGLRERDEAARVLAVVES